MEFPKKKEVEANEEKIVSKGPRFGHRHIQATFLFLCITIEYMSRACFSLLIIAMADPDTSSNPNVPTYDWDDTNIILSSFYWGYIILQVLAGQLSKSYGSKWLLFGATAINSLGLALVPLAAKVAGSKGVMICRILQGLGQGGIFPSSHTMLGRWAPEDERSRMTTFVYTGISVGSIVCLPITGWISNSDWGWPATCYLIGGLGFIWCAAWVFVAHNSPAEDPYISLEERKYIESSLGQKKNQKVLPTPWKHMFTNLPFWACFITTIGSGFGVIFLQNEVPTYLKNVMEFDVAASGYITAITGAVGVLFNFIFGFFSDFLIVGNYISATTCRKICEIISTFGCAGTMIGLGYLDKSQSNLSICMLTLSAVFGAALLYGHGINPIDLSPRFSGVILGIVNSISCAVALFAPLAVQFIVTDEKDATLWRIVFLIAAVMYMVPALVFIFFGSAERQWWDAGDNEATPTRKISTVSDVVGISVIQYRNRETTKEVRH